ncbi:MAG: PcfJ domain-containing protein [Myxococcales bacterium]|nr:PcfJ domain-containing protein [Myxococcales bacterium]
MDRVVNQHRRLGLDEPGRRYLRRHDDLAAREFDEALRSAEEPAAWTCDCDQCAYVLSPADFILHSAAASLAGFERPGFARLRHGPAPVADSAPSPSAGDLASVMLAHLRAVVIDGLDVTLDASALGQAARSGLRLAARDTPALAAWCAARPGAVAMLLALAPFWIRSLDGWAPPADADGEDVGLAVMKHLLVRYPVPVPLYAPWRGTSPPPFKWAVWLVVLGQGGSLHDAARVFGWRVARALTGWLAQAPVELGPVEAVMWAELRRLRVGEPVVRRLGTHPAYLLDPTDDGEGALHDPFGDDRAPLAPASQAAQRRFWDETVAWLQRHGAALTDDDTVAVLDWAMHCHIEGARPGGVPFRWRGRTAASVLADARSYHQRVTAGRGWANGAAIAWARHRDDWAHEDVDGRWLVRELCSGDALAEESQALLHCVFGYAYRCVQGLSQIYSVAHDDERTLTIELDAGGDVVQVRGRANRAPTERELQIVARWRSAAPGVASARAR